MKTKLSILIVDDHKAMATTLKDILEEEDHHVVTASSGKEAIRACQNQTFNVILMDVRMPDLNGIEVFRRIKNFSSNIRVIMMSAYSVDELKKQALKEGAIAFLQKPLDIEKVLKLIEQTEQPPVLIVMDDKSERQKLVAKLKKENYRAYTTKSSYEALDLAGQIHFHLIMLDANLPKTNGLELYLALKKITPSSVAVMLAEIDKHSLKIAKEAVQNNAYTFFEKPVDLDKLLTILGQIKTQQISNSLEKPDGASG